VNHLSLTAQIDFIDNLRYSPSGVPVVDFVLAHESTAVEADKPRKIQLKMKSMAIGTLAERVSGFKLGSSWLFNGFLSSSKNMKSIVFHIQEISTVS
jgi:primosomal replication protein N